MEDSLGITKVRKTTRKRQGKRGDPSPLPLLSDRFRSSENQNEWVIDPFWNCCVDPIPTISIRFTALDGPLRCKFSCIMKERTSNCQSSEFLLQLPADSKEFPDRQSYSLLPEATPLYHVAQLPNSEAATPRELSISISRLISLVNSTFPAVFGKPGDKQFTRMLHKKWQLRWPSNRVDNI